jgi:hypothetical protein
VERNSRVGFIPNTFVNVVQSDLDIVNATINLSQTPDCLNNDQVQQQVESTIFQFEDQLHKYLESFVGSMSNVLKSNTSETEANFLYEIEKLKLQLREKERKIEALQKMQIESPM